MYVNVIHKPTKKKKNNNKVIKIKASIPTITAAEFFRIR